MATGSKPRSQGYDAPGGADELSRDLRGQWNKVIEDNYREQSAQTLFLGDEKPDPSLTLRTSLFRLEAAARSPNLLAKWPADPLQPTICVGFEGSERICDSRQFGRSVGQMEYCETRIVEGKDGDRKRPKRVEVTTELREFWVCVAENDPKRLQEMAADILGFVPAWDELYGTNPDELEPYERRRAFAKLVAGNGGQKDLEDLPVQPQGRLNTEYLLFMTYPLNGLDNLLQLLLLSAHPYAGPGNADPVTPADPSVIFAAIGDPSFACRRADPAVMAEGQDAALAGEELLLANPPGIFILNFTSEVFRYNGGPLPEGWVRRLRPRDADVCQRLEIGPPDGHPAFLDDIVDTVQQRPLTGGFQVLRQLEVGVRLVRRAPVTSSTEPLLHPRTEETPQPCSASDDCADFRARLEELDQDPVSVAPSPPS